MFCRFCGYKIRDNAIFCEKCGKKQEFNLPSAETIQKPQRVAAIPEAGRNTSHFQTGKGNFIATAKFNPNGIIAQLVISLIMTMVGVGTLIWANQLRWYERAYYNQDFFKTCAVLLIVCGCIALISEWVTIVVNSDIQCTAFENKVVGTAVNSRWSFSKKDFEFTYDEIDTISSNRRIITISSNGTPYIVAAGSEYEANVLVSVIRERIKPGADMTFHTPLPRQMTDNSIKWKCSACQALNSNIVAKCLSCGASRADSQEFVYAPVKRNDSRKAGENEWKCPGCGRINQNYVGTCGCGTLRNSR